MNTSTDMFLSRVILKNWYTTTTKTKILDDSAVSVSNLKQNDSVWAKNYSVVPQDGRWRWWETTKLGQIKTGSGMWTFWSDDNPWSVKTDTKYERTPKVNLPAQSSQSSWISRLQSANLTKIENYNLSEEKRNENLEVEKSLSNGSTNTTW